MSKQTLYIFSVAVLCGCALWSEPAHAGQLTFVSDLISTSAADADAAHRIRFTTANPVPPSGSIVLTPQDGAFIIPAGFDFTDVDVATSSGGTYGDRTLAATADGANDGVSATVGSSGAVVITLNATEGIAGGVQIEVELGTNATFGTTGDRSLVNPSATTSYSMEIETRDALNGLIDQGTAMISIVDQVILSLTNNPVPPVLSNGLPSGLIPHNNSSIEISLNTNELSTCRYATTTDVAYSDMLGVFAISGLSLVHATVISGHQDGTAYTYNVRCADHEGTANSVDFPISFTLDSEPEQEVTGGSSGAFGSGGSGQFPRGSKFLHLANVTISGFAFPASTVTFLKDGEEQGSVIAAGDGSFSQTLNELERGTYTFLAYATDAAGRRSASFSSTLSLGQATNNTISGIIIPPTIELEEEAVLSGNDVRVFGQSIPGSTVELHVQPQGGASSIGDARTYSATTSDGTLGTTPGRWEITFPSAGLAQGTYEVRARTVRTPSEESNFSRVLFLGIGQDPSPDFSLRADINKDGKVNLVDFSIMLSFWNTTDADADINSNGTVGLEDFSIMLFNWTG